MKTKDLAIIALLIALSFVLSFFKFFGSVAMDSVPAFLALLLWRDYKAGVIAGMGHMFSAISSGLPFGLFTHLLIAILMFITFYLAALLLNKKIHLTFVLIYIYILNAIIMPFVIFITITFSVKLYLTIMIALSIAVIINMIVALILYQLLAKVIKND